MNICSSVANYVNSVNKKAQAFYKSVKCDKFINPPFTSSIVQERMMRIGIEAKYTHAYTNDELYLIALATLHEDYIKHYSGKTTVLITCILDVIALFKSQIHDGVFYYMVYNNDRAEIVKSNDYEYILNHYTYAEIGESTIPTLY